MARTNIHETKVGGFLHDAAQDPAATAAALVEIVEGLPSRLNPEADGHADAVQAFWDGVGALATDNGYEP